MTDLRITTRLAEALTDVQGYTDRGHGYPLFWKEKSIAKLEAAGMVERRDGDLSRPFWLTEAGRKALTQYLERNQ